MARMWEPDEIDFLVRHLTYGVSDIYGMYCEEFGAVRSYDSIQKRVKRLREAHLGICGTSIDSPSLAIEIEGDFDEEDEEEIGSYEDLPLTPVSPKLMKEHAMLWLHAIATTVEGQDMTPADGVKSSNPSLIIVISDVHIGKKTDIFDSTTAMERVLSMPEEIVRAGNVPDSVDEVVILSVGDLTEGEDIYPGQNGVIEMPVIKQSKLATEVYWQLAHDCHSTFDVPVRMEFVPGNHGRMSKTANPMSNWDNNVCQCLQLMSNVAPHEWITFNPNFDKFNVIDVKGKKIGMHHKGVKHMGTPAMQVKFAGWTISKDLDLLVHGHWHSWSTDMFLGRPVITNGSVCGPDDLAEDMAKEEPPKQAYFLVYPDEDPNCFSFVGW